MVPKNRFIVVVNSWDTNNVLTYINRLLIKYKVNGRVRVLKNNIHRACIYIVANAGRMYSVLFIGDLFAQAKKDGFYCGQLTEYDDEEILADEIIRSSSSPSRRSVRRKKDYSNKYTPLKGKQPTFLYALLFALFVFFVTAMIMGW